MCEKYHSRIDILTISDNEIKDLPVGQWSTMMYYKLFMPVILPRFVERCLFLDVDMIINDDIDSLYHWNLQGHVIAATEDIPDCVVIKERIGLNKDDLYINAGVMVCDIVKWREMETEKPIFDFIRTVANRIVNEQDVLALYFKGLITLLPIRWNMVTFYYFREPKIFPKYQSELQAGKRDPGIIHFAAPIKPWFRDCQHPFKYLYKYFLKKTVWGGNYVFPYWENLTWRQRVNKVVRKFLNKYGFIKDPLYLVPLSKWL